MVKPLAALQIPRPDRRAALWWIADSVGAVLFAAGLAHCISHRIVFHQADSLGPALIVAGAAWRGAAQAQARARGALAAAMLRRSLRHALIPRLLPSRPARGSLVGEDMHLAVDAIAATE